MDRLDFSNFLAHMALPGPPHHSCTATKLHIRPQSCSYSRLVSKWLHQHAEQLVAAHAGLSHLLAAQDAAGMQAVAVLIHTVCGLIVSTQPCGVAAGLQVLCMRKRNFLQDEHPMGWRDLPRRA